MLLFVLWRVYVWTRSASGPRINMSHPETGTLSRLSTRFLFRDDRRTEKPTYYGTTGQTKRRDGSRKCWFSRFCEVLPVTQREIRQEERPPQPEQTGGEQVNGPRISVVC